MLPGKVRSRNSPALRKPNTDAIAAMALDNYLEMRERVADPKFQLQQALSLELERRFPERFIPRYSMVMFHHEIPYRTALERGAVQARLLEELTVGRGPASRGRRLRARGTRDPRQARALQLMRGFHSLERDEAVGIRVLVIRLVTLARRLVPLRAPPAREHRVAVFDPVHVSR